MDDATVRPRKWKRWAVALLIAITAGGWLLIGRSPVDRARKIQTGMTRSEVHQIMGPSQMRFKVLVDVGASARIEAGECWDSGGVVRANIDHWRRKLGLLR